MSDPLALSILLPDSVLPPEGSPPVPLRDQDGTRIPKPAALLEALTFTLFSRTVALAPARISSAWRHAYLRRDTDQPGRVWLDLTPGCYDLDFDTPISDSPATGASNPRQAQVAAVRKATRPFAGRAIPLFAPEATETAETLAGESLLPLAIWLATTEQLTEVSRADGSREAFELWLEEDDAEVEGRGLREIVLAAALTLMGFQGTAPSAAGAPDPFEAASPVVSTSAVLPAVEGDLQVLPVTSQNLRQAPPRVDRTLLADQAADADPTRTRIIVDIARQRAFLLVDGRIAVDTPVSTGASGHDTPRGTFTISEKVRQGKVSTIYHSALPFWMRLSETAVGLHVEKLPGQAASHGCVRLPRESAKVLFEHTPSGTTVEIVDTWNQTALAQR